MVSRRCSKDSGKALRDRWNTSGSRRNPSACNRSLPDCEAHLDAKLDAIQRRNLLLLPRGVLLVHRREVLSPVGIPAGCCWDEFDRGLPDRSSMGGLHYRQSAYPSRLPDLSIIWSRPGATDAWHGRDVDLLAHTALDASKESLPSYLKWRDFPGPRSVEAKAIAAQGKACRCSSGS